MTHQTNAQRLANDIMCLLPGNDGKPFAEELRRLSAIEQERDQLRGEADQFRALAKANADSLGEALAEIKALKDGQASGEVVAYKVNWPGVDSVGMRRFYGADEWEASKATVEFFGGVAIPLTATPKPVPMTEWQPIETAPKDGTELIGWRDDCGVILIRWTSCDAFMSEREIESSRMDEETLFQQDWFCADFIAGCRLDGSETPTHWMPLPPPPDHGISEVQE